MQMLKDAIEYCNKMNVILHYGKDLKPTTKGDIISDALTMTLLFITPKP